MRRISNLAPGCVSVLLAALTPACGSYGLAPGTGTGGTGGSTGSGGSGGTSGGTTVSATYEPGDLPCDIFEKGGHPCVSAHSTVRALAKGYTGALYQVKLANGMTKDIGIVGGYADAAAQDAFCSVAGGCTISIIYDQSPQKNDLTPAPPGGAKPTPGDPANAADLKVTVNGHPAYGILFKRGMGYRKLVGNGTAVGDEPESMYMVSSSKDLINGCCFDYGNAETDAHDDGNGTMEAVYVGMGVIWGTGVQGGPWAMADLENGLYAGWENGQDRNISTNTPLKYNYVTAAVVGYESSVQKGGRFAVYGGDATTGAVKTMYDGIRPEKPGYLPMQKQGSVILSIGGDNSDFDGGRFYEGAMANGAATKETIDALQSSIVAAGYAD